QGRSCPAGPAGHLPMGAEDPALRPPPALRAELPLPPCGGSPLRRHLPLRRCAPPPHEWGGQGPAAPSGPPGGAAPPALRRTTPPAPPAPPALRATSP